MTMSERAKRVDPLDVFRIHCAQGEPVVEHPAEHMRLSLPDLREALRSMGYDRVQSMAGPMTLEAWDPYGMKGVNRRFFGGKVYFGRIVRDEDGSVRVVDAPEDPAMKGFLLGGWPMLRAETAVRA